MSRVVGYYTYEVENLSFKIMSKIGDTIRFRFAGCWESGVVTEVVKKGNKILSYRVKDSKYTYSVDRVNVKK
jgi:hypothetical protein